MFNYCSSEDDSDMHLERGIMQNKKYNTTGNMEDEYDYDRITPSKKNWKRRGSNREKGHNEKANADSERAMRLLLWEPFSTKAPYGIDHQFYMYAISHAIFKFTLVYSYCNLL